MRTDNGAPFASSAVGGLSRLAVWWIKLGIVPERIEAGHPEQNGRHERMHRTLKLDLRPAEDWRGQQRELDRFRHEYNQVRPHEALGMQTPASVYEPSPRPYPGALPEVTIPTPCWCARSKATGISAGKSMMSFSVKFVGRTDWPAAGRRWILHHLLRAHAPGSIRRQNLYTGPAAPWQQGQRQKQKPS